MNILAGVLKPNRSVNQFYGVNFCKLVLDHLLCIVLFSATDHNEHSKSWLGLISLLHGARSRGVKFLQTLGVQAFKSSARSNSGACKCRQIFT
ncbi:hypothetical protein TSAR_008804 [Trichomalopsis sarcophagae]|uniref:Uncharacterized protein n=1 Tax=Trichomalopsis sarcophagae TaxID=543379 RepID=A0A232EHQ6_9HYME|nr:hypothetical protein TSAR_008804 [Trichomalopsis sarcophagae]